MSDGELSLYFALKKGENANLEVIAQAALHWTAALRVAALTIDPRAQIRIELLNADQGSLRLHTFLEWAEGHLERIDKGSSRYPRLRNLALGLAIFVASAMIAPHLDILGSPAVVDLSDEDRALLIDVLDQMRSVPKIGMESRRFFKTLEQDPSITGVGIAEGRHEIPAISVPRDQFAERGGLWVVEEASRERTLTLVRNVILISPVLLPNPRSWRFKEEGMPEFNAIMKDARFLAALEESHVRETLRTGIPMTIRLEVKERKINGEWVVRRGGRTVVEVISPVVVSLPSEPE